jgi:hypothetical protein
MFKIICILSLIFLFFLPDVFWQRFSSVFNKYFLKIKNNKLDRAKKFRRYLDQVIVSYRLGKEFKREGKIDYSPFSKNLEKLLKMKALYGSCISSQLQLLKQDIHEEIIFVDQNNKVSRAAHMQFLCMMLIILSFQFFSSQIFELNFDFKTAFYCLALESIGFLLFHVISNKKLKIIFKEVNELQSFFSEAESLLYGQLPANRVVQELAEISPILKGDIVQEIQGQLFYLLRNWQQSGLPIREDFKLLKLDLLYHRRELMIKAKKFLELMVFVTLVLFFLSSYFLSLSPLLQVIFVA